MLKDLDLPPGFRSWSIDQQADFVAFQTSRDEQIRALRERVAVDHEERSDRLTQNDLARLMILIYYGKL